MKRTIKPISGLTRTRSIAGSGLTIGLTITYPGTKIRHSIEIDFYLSRLWAEAKPSTDYTDNLRNLWMALRDDHCAGAFVGEDLGKQGIAFVAADDVGAVNTAFQQDNDAL